MNRRKRNLWVVFTVLLVFSSFTVVLAQDLFEPIAKGDLVLVNRALEQGANINQRREDGFTPLMFAATTGNSEIMALLIEKGANLNARETEGWSFLHFLVENTDDLAFVSKVIGLGADLNAKNKIGETPLSIALCHEQVEVAWLLLEQGADPNCNDLEGISPLAMAHRKSLNTDLFEELLKRGADPNCSFSSERNESLFEHILWFPADAEYALLLLEYGADAYEFDQFGNDLFQSLVFRDADPRIFRILLARGALGELFSWDDEPRDLSVALHLLENLEYLEMLAEFGFDFRTLYDGKNTLLNLAVRWCDFYDLEDAVVFLAAQEKQLAPDERYANYYSGTLYYVFQGPLSPRVLWSLLEAGANIHILEEWYANGNLGWTDFLPYDSLLRAVVEAGFDLTTKDLDGLTLLVKASGEFLDGNGSIELIEFLAREEREKGFSLSQSDYYGLTVLWPALEWSSEARIDQIVKTILDMGVDPNYQEPLTGCPMLVLAAMKTKYPKVIEYLIAAGADGTVRYNKKKAYDYAKKNPYLENTAALQLLKKVRGGLF